MKKEIFFISPYPEMTELANRIVKQGFKEIGVTTATLAKGVEKAKELESNDTQIIISRGATGALIRDSIQIPVIFVNITCYDIILALYKAKKIGKKIALFIYSSHKNDHNFKEIRKILGLKDELLIYFYDSLDELYKQLYKAHEVQCDVAVAAGSCILEKARMLKINGVMIGSNEEALKGTFVRAIELLKVKKKDEEIKKQLKAILNHANGGVLAINATGIVTYYNNIARDTLQLPTQEVIGKKIDDLKTNSIFRKIYANGETFVGGIITLNNCNYIVNRLPLKIESGDLGMVINFQKTQNIEKIEAEIRKKLYDKGFTAFYGFSDIITRSEKIVGLIHRAKNYSKIDGTVLIMGESGTGKELFAQSIHKSSSRQNEAFVAINCATLPSNLLESELFGYNEGAFTGAKKGGKPGLFELAHKGTIFLDEILELPIALQAHLLRVLQERNVRRIGGDKLIPVDVRIIASANKCLLDAVDKGNFRMDLYYRLNEFNLHIPPLKNRKKDLPVLINHFIEKHRNFIENQLQPSEGPDHFSDTAERNEKSVLYDKANVILNEKNMTRLYNYSWPGNIRELENFVKRYLLLAYSDDESPDLILDELFNETFPSSQESFTMPGEGPNSAYDITSPGYGDDVIPVKIGTLKEMEGDIIMEVYKNWPHKKEELADILGISRTTLWKKLKLQSANGGVRTASEPVSTLK